MDSGCGESSHGSHLTGYLFFLDRISPERRSWQMSRVKQMDAGPKLVVRRMVHALGYRYRLHVRRLPGSPDLVFASRRKVIFVHGCFWHGHEKCSLATVPKTRTEFWLEKFDANRQRDRKVVSSLCELGWATLTIWQCEIKDASALEARIRAFLDLDVPT